MTMKKFLWLVFIFIIISCVSNLYEPLKHPDQRIQLGGFSFLSPPGKNWEVYIGDTGERNIHLENWGRSTWKMKAFKKNLVGPNPASGETEKLMVRVDIYEFALMNFDQDEDLMDFDQYGNKELNKRGISLLERSSSHEKINGMNCIRSKGKAEDDGRRWGFSLSAGFIYPAVEIYIQRYSCVHPTRLNYIITLRSNQIVLKGQPPTDIQSELDPFFASLQFH